MRKLFVVFAVLLSGCSVFGTPRPFDAVEYDYAIQASVAATRAVHQCIDPSDSYIGFVKDLTKATMHLNEYEKFRPSGAELASGASELRQLVIDFTSKKKLTYRYCQHKLSEVQSAARVMAMAFGGQAKMSMCFSDVGIRYGVYLDSLNDNSITRAEFDELVADLQRLASIDQSGCTVEARLKLKQTLEAISKVASFALSL